MSGRLGHTGDAVAVRRRHAVQKRQNAERTPERTRQLCNRDARGDQAVLAQTRVATEKIKAVLARR